MNRERVLILTLMGGPYFHQFYRRSLGVWLVGDEQHLLFATQT